MRRDGLLLGAAVALSILTSAVVMRAARTSEPEPAPARATGPDSASALRRIAALEERFGRISDRLAEAEAQPGRVAPPRAEPAPRREPGAEIEAILRSDGHADAKVASLIALGHALTAKQDLASAADALAEALRLAREGTQAAFDASYFLAWNEFNQGRKEEALARLEEIATDERAPPFPRGRAHWAATLFAYHLEERDRALGHLVKLRGIEHARLRPLVRDLENRLADLDPKKEEDD